ncbi:MAG TPA: triose-phosphate isomerase [Myxococcota bacterium]|nr:triose-phosphate isomerase [Myxococcota bacterium]HRY93410.1 triose-phosphate isomerase [Myxococcota bacterium]HSA21329.1 triose-phosphate isomerase [Myxococcota bacterium]
MDELGERIARLVRQVIEERLAVGGELASASTPGGRRRPLVAANWKMNGSRAMAEGYPSGLRPAPGVELVLCPPLVLLPPLAAALRAAPGLPEVGLGAQNLHFEPKGAFTGEHSPGMLREAGCRYVILGHSERRAMFGDDDALVARKVRAALAAGLRPILCVGERLEERESGATFRVLRAQLTAALAGLGPPAPAPGELVVAYEPVWAIGTGRTASAAQAEEALAFLRERLAELFSWAWARGARLLYGGSATPENAAALGAQPDVDGFLVGGASLEPAKLSAMALKLSEVRAR